MPTLVRGGSVATAGWSGPADVLAVDGRIAAVGPGLEAPEGALVLDAGGCIVMPGGVDVHTHFALDTGAARVVDGFATGTAAAALGGSTCVVEHPGFGPAGCGLLHQVEAYRALADGNCVVDYGLHGVAQRADPKALADLPRLVAAGCPTLKAYTTYAGKLEEPGLLALMDASAGHGVLVAVHCEDDALVAHLGRKLRESAPADPMSHPRSRPDYAEALAVRQATALARATGAALYVVHLSSAAGLAAVEDALDQGVDVTAETCPQYLLLDQSLYGGPDGLGWVMAPPLRAEADREALWDGLARGVISVVGTDHCAFSLKQKRLLGGGDVFRCPGGAPGVQTRLALLYTYGVLAGRISLERFVDVVATAPARIMGIPGKGGLEPGQDADIAVLDASVERVISPETLCQGVDFTPFAGLAARGWPRHVLLRGSPIVRDGALRAGPGTGRFVQRRLP